MSKIKIVDYKDTRNKKHVPVKVSYICDNCGKECFLEYKDRRWPRSYSAMRNILNAAVEDKDVKIFCSKSCSNSARDHSYMDKINSTFDIECVNCNEYNECSFKNLNNGIQKASKSIKCYTKKNLMDKNLLKWRNSEENKKRWVKVGRDKQNYFWDIYFSNNKENKDWVKAKEFCEEKIRVILENRGPGASGLFGYKRDKNGKITHIYNISINEYIDNIKKLPINMVPDEFFIIPTFRSQNSETRNLLLDEYLENNNIKWFVYIKYDELGHPLVVGKSGSKLVNSSGCDIVFDKNPNGGPARQYLIENNLDWNKTQIAISKSFDLEKEALTYEYVTCRKYGLFSS